MHHSISSNRCKWNWSRCVSTELWLCLYCDVNRKKYKIILYHNINCSYYLMLFWIFILDSYFLFCSYYKSNIVIDFYSGNSVSKYNVNIYYQNVRELWSKTSINYRNVCLNSYNVIIWRRHGCWTVWVTRNCWTVYMVVAVC